MYIVFSVLGTRAATKFCVAYAYGPNGCHLLIHVHCTCLQAIYGWLAFTQAATSAVSSWTTIDCSLLSNFPIPKSMQQVAIIVLSPYIYIIAICTLWVVRWMYLKTFRKAK